MGLTVYMEREHDSVENSKVLNNKHHKFLKILDDKFEILASHNNFTAALLSRTNGIRSSSPSIYVWFHDYTFDKDNIKTNFNNGKEDHKISKSLSFFSVENSNFSILCNDKENILFMDIWTSKELNNGTDSYWKIVITASTIDSLYRWECAYRHPGLVVSIDMIDSTIHSKPYLLKLDSCGEKVAFFENRNNIIIRSEVLKRYRIFNLNRLEEKIGNGVSLSFCGNDQDTIISTFENGSVAVRS